jgi:hypothetical protein
MIQRTLGGRREAALAALGKADKAIGPLVLAAVIKKRRRVVRRSA